MEVTQQIVDQLEQVRQSGKTNMFNRRGVQMIASSMELYSLVCWIADYPKDYMDLLTENYTIKE